MLSYDCDEVLAARGSTKTSIEALLAVCRAAALSGAGYVSAGLRVQKRGACGRLIYDIAECGLPANQEDRSSQTRAATSRTLPR
jgi:hypothetical protein